SLALVAWGRKKSRGPRPPLILGLVLGDIIERYMFISVGRYGLEWMGRPLVVLMFAMALIGLSRPLMQDYRTLGGVGGIVRAFGRARFQWGQLFTLFYLTVIASLFVMALPWRFNAKIVPIVVSCVGLIAVTLSLLNQLFRKSDSEIAAQNAAAGMAAPAQSDRIHMD